MYEQIKKEDVLEELNNGSDLYCVDIPTARVMQCTDMRLSAIKGFIDKPETMFFKAVANGQA